MKGVVKMRCKEPTRAQKKQPIGVAVGSFVRKKLSVDGVSLVQLSNETGIDFHILSRLINATPHGKGNRFRISLDELQSDALGLVVDGK